MSFLLELLVTIFLAVSGIFGLVGSVGLLKLRDSLQRLHAPTKATTLGVGGVLIASMIYFWASTGYVTVHELLITLFLFLTAPITANFIAKAYIARNRSRKDLPDSPTEYGWSVYDDPPPGRPDQAEDARDQPAR